MLMYGLFHNPFYDEKAFSFCDYCMERNKRERVAIKNTKIAGPIFLALGIVLIICGVVKRWWNLRKHVKQGTDATSSTGGAVVGYAVSGNVAENQASLYQPVPTAEYKPPYIQSQPTPQVHYTLSQFQGEQGSQQFYPPFQQTSPAAQQYQQLPTQQFYPPTQQFSLTAQQYPPHETYPAQGNDLKNAPEAVQIATG